MWGKGEVIGSKRAQPPDLGEACVREALAIIADVGVEGLSLREVARRLGVSHQAPYKHYPSRDHLLAEVVNRAFLGFAAHLDARPCGGSPEEDLAAMGRAYIGFALAHPLQYRLMFGTPLPDPAHHPEMMKSAQHAFGLLRDSIARLAERHGGGSPLGQVQLDALFVWATVHGLSSLLRTHALGTLDLPPDVLEAAVPHTLQLIGAALAPTEGPTEQNALWDGEASVADG